MKRISTRILVVILAITLLMSGNLSMVAMAQETSTMNEKKISSVIEISTEKDLKNISNNIYGNYRLKNNIKLSSKKWNSIPEFYGTLDGNGYTISNFRSADGNGLFKQLKETGVIRNLTISGNVETKSITGTLLVCLSRGTIVNCTTIGSVIQKENIGDGVSQLAGMVAQNMGYMENCVNKANIEHAFEKKSDTWEYEYYTSAAGLVGSNNGVIVNCKNYGDVISNCVRSGGIIGSNSGGAIVKDCINYGNVTAKLEMENAPLITGGIVGDNGYSFVYNCENQGDIQTIAQYYGYSIGGIVGETSGTSQIISCKNRGRVKGRVGEVGGIVGSASITTGGFDENGDFITNSGAICISDCLNEGIIEILAVEERSSSVGGVIGEACSANGKVLLRNCTNEGVISCDGYVSYCAGVAGLFYVYKDGTVEADHLINKSIVSSEKGNASGVFGGAQGGIKESIVITNCYNTADLFAGNAAEGIGSVLCGVLLKSCYNTGDVIAEYAYGITGHVNECIIEDCYNLGTVEGYWAHGIGGVISEGSILKNVYNYGKLIGEETTYATVQEIEGGQIHNCYYLEESLVADNVGIVRFGTEMSLEEAQNQETYVGFDFDTIWEMKNQNNVSLPALRLQDVYTNVELKQEKVTLQVGNTASLKILNGKIIAIYSLKPTIAMVGKDGVITAENAGKTEIYVISMDGQVFTCQVIVEAQSISKASVKLSKTNYTCDEKEKKPTVTVKLGGKTLKKDTDYTVTYKNNKNIGKATVTIKGKGNYIGTINKTFTISLGKGKTFKTGSYMYKVTGTNTIAFAGINSTKTTTVKIADTVKYGGKTFKITSVAEKALYKKTKVKKVTIGKNVTTIGNSAFEGCTKLSSVAIGSNVIKIGNKVFKQCVALKQITVPSKMKTIGKEAFYGCKNLKTITVKSTKLTSVGKNAFKGIYSKATIRVPKSKLKTYQKLMKSKGQSKNVKIK